MEWMLMPYRRYADFSGRSRRKEFWMFQLFNVIVITVIYALILGGGGYSMLVNRAALTGTGDSVQLGAAAAAAPGPLMWIGFALLAIYGLGTIIPSLAVTVRRLHDRNTSGWYLLGFVIVAMVLTFIPIIGQLLMFAMEIGYIVVMALPGTPGPNKYGPDPLDPNQAEVFA